MDGLSPFLQLCISSLASGLQVVWPTAADSSGSFCESFGFDKGQKNRWRVPSPSWCVNFLLAQQTADLPRLSASCSLAGEATGSVGEWDGSFMLRMVTPHYV